MALLELLFGGAFSKLHGVALGSIAHDTPIAPELSRAEYYAVGRSMVQRFGSPGVNAAGRIARVLWFAPKYVPAACSCWYVANMKGLPVALYTPASDNEN